MLEAPGKYTKNTREKSATKLGDPSARAGSCVVANDKTSTLHVNGKERLKLSVEPRYTLYLPFLLYGLVPPVW